MQRLYKDISNGLENVPVYIETKAAEVAFPNFQYSPENVQGRGCDCDPREVTLPGCSCLQPCSPSSCPCLRFGKAYTAEGHLIEPQKEPGTGYSQPLFECNILCTCADSCQCRVVQNGVRHQLCIFHTETRGWGVKTLEPIEHGSFVCEYAGEVIGFDEARRRQLAQTPKDRNYIIAMQEHRDTERLGVTFVDPAAVGNVGRFLNHSCQPNLVMVPVRVHSVVPRLALFAKRHIELGEELTFDYSGGHDNSVESGSGGGGAELQRKLCLCGATICAGFLPLDLTVIN